MPATVTVTGKAGPGITVTAAVFTNVASFAFLTQGKEMLELSFTDGTPITYISIAAATTITVTVSGDVYTVSIS